MPENPRSRGGENRDRSYWWPCSRVMDCEAQGSQYRRDDSRRDRSTPWPQTGHLRYRLSDDPVDPASSGDGGLAASARRRPVHRRSAASGLE